MSFAISINLLNGMERPILNKLLNSTPKLISIFLLYSGSDYLPKTITSAIPFSDLMKFLGGFTLAQNLMNPVIKDLTLNPKTKVVHTLMGNLSLEEAETKVISVPPPEILKLRLNQFLIPFCVTYFAAKKLNWNANFKIALAATILSNIVFFRMKKFIKNNPFAARISKNIADKMHKLGISR